MKPQPTRSPAKRDWQRTVNTMWFFVLSIVSATVAVGNPLCVQWDHVVYARQWAQAVCLDNERSLLEPCCYIPKNVTNWTIHGVWPSRGSEKKPTGCPQCAKPFNPDQIAPIEDALKKIWPTLFPTAKPDAMHKFWQHEWEKHGRCGVDVAAMKDELSYFKTGMALDREFNLDQVLRLRGIVPSKTKLYPIPRFLKALVHAFGARPIIECYHDKVLGKQYVTQVELCLSRTFKPVDCPPQAGVKNMTERCMQDTPISYPPIDNGRQFPPGCLNQDTKLYYVPHQ